MGKEMVFGVRQAGKMLLQNVVLPLIYSFWSWIYRGRRKTMIIFADGHHEDLPVSMELLYRTLEGKGHELTEFFYDFGKMSALWAGCKAMGFMRLYARAKFVFICDNFLPVSACRKDQETKVIQLWHACGLVKKMGYDTAEDIPVHYRGNVYRNYDLVTVSAPCCIKPMAGAMRLPEERFQPLGISRTDVYFDPVWRESCREQFFAQYPRARGKKIILWAPTFRGSAADPYQVGAEDIQRLEERLGNGYFVIRKVHPHVDGKRHLSNCAIPTERLLAAADLLVTDYSSVMTEFLFFAKPCVLFAPDLEEYEKKRGFYVPYGSLSPYIVTDGAGLYDTCMAALGNSYAEWAAKQRAFHTESCDGNVTRRIIKYLGL